MAILVAAIADISNARAVLWYRVSTFFSPAVFATTSQAALLALTPILTVAYCMRQPFATIQSDILLLTKIFTASLLSGCRIYDRAQNHQSDRWPYYDADPQAVAVLESVCIIWLLYATHVYDIQPSFTLSIYLALSIVIHGLQWWMEAQLSQSVPLLPMFIVLGSFVLLILHETPKWHLLPKHRKKIVGLQSAFGIFGRSAATWLYPALVTGFWAPLQVSDLDALPPDLLVRNILPNFDRIWLKYRYLPRGLAKTCAILNWKAIVISTIAKSIVTVGKLSIPYLTQQVVKFQTSNFKDLNPDVTCWSKTNLLSLTFILFSALAGFNGCALYYQTRVTTILQGALSGSVFAKLLDLSDEDINDSVPFSIITGDIPEAMQAVRFYQDAVFYGIEAAVPLIMLWPHMGFITFIPCAVLVGASKLANVHSLKLPSIQKALEEKRQSREDQNNNSLHKLKEIKMTAREAVLHKILNEMRDSETELFAEYHTQQANRYSITASCSTIVQVISLFAQPTSSESKLANILKCSALLFISSLSYDFALASYWKSARSYDCMSSIAAFLNIPTEDLTTRKPKDTLAMKTYMIQFEQAFIAPKRNTPAVLKGVNLTIPMSTISILTGKAATGKTTFAKSLISHPHILGGSLSIATKSIGFCGQKSWLQHRTIKSNIIGPAKFDEVWYNKVKVACNLDQDISQYPDNDNYVIGRGRLRLTEGQRQKIALARAIYSKPSLLVLDDAFAAIDRFTVESILNRLFGHKGLLMNKTTIVITATDPAPFCNIANRFFTLDAHGNISWTERSSIISEAIRLRQLSMGIPNIIEQDVVKVHHKALPKEATVQLSQLSHIHQSIDKAPLSFYFRYVDRFMVYRFFITVVLSALAQFSFQIMASLGYYSNNPTQPVILVTAACALLYGSILASTGYHFYVKIAAKVSKDLHTDLLNAVSELHLIFLTPAKLHQTVRLFNEGMRVLTTDLPHGIFQSFYRLAVISAVCGLLVWANSSISLALPIIGIAAYLLKQVYYPTSTRLHHMQLASKASLQAHFAEAAAGTGYVRTFQWENGYLTSILGAINKQQKVFYYKTSLDQCLDVVVDGLVTIIVVMFLGFVLGTDASPAVVGSAFVGCLYIQPELKESFAAWFLMDDGRTTLEEMRQIIKTIPEEVVNQEVAVPSNWPTAGLIELKNVTIWYNRNEPPVLENINLVMHDASEIGLLGRPQTGKTALLFTFLNELPYTGSITIDGVEVRTIPRDKLAQQITVVPQEVIIFPGSIRQNLIPDEFFHPAEVSLQPVEDGEEGEVEEVKAYTFMMERILYRLGLLDIIKAAGGLDTDIAKVSMSTEQLHRFSLAQSLTTFFLRQTKITLVDDITSKVGHGDCVMMRQAIRELMGDVTAVAVAHHPSAIIGSDAIGEIKDNSASIRRRVIMQRDPDDEEDPGNRALLPTAYPVPEIDRTLPQNQLQSQPRQAGPSSSQSHPQPQAAGPAHSTSSQPPNPPAIAGPSKPKTQPQKQPPANPDVPAPKPVPVVERPVEIDPTLSARQRQKLPAVSLRKKVLQKQTRSAIISSLVKKSPKAATVESPKEQPSKADATLSAKQPSSDSSQ